jgi:hypothetical protein
MDVPRTGEKSMPAWLISTTLVKKRSIVLSIGFTRRILLLRHIMIRPMLAAQLRLRVGVSTSVQAPGKFTSRESKSRAKQTGEAP